MSVYHKESPEYLSLSISSILNQTVPSDDIVIVKDGPLTHELDLILNNFARNYRNINIVSLEKNVGLGAALNAGLKECKNELVARMDTDDIALENRCELQLAEFENDKKLDIVGTFMYEFSNNPDDVKTIKTVPVTHEEIYKFAKRRNPFNHPTVMYKKSVILSNGGYSNMRRGQDIDLFTRILYKGCKGKNINKPLLKYRTNEAMINRRKSWVTTKSYISVIYNSWKMGYAGINDLIYVFVLQVGMMVCPTPIVKWVHNKFLRKAI
jgi:glycosyltransferase involved in cell wall biosynthesis